mmetsp:Transcript_11364/g.10289  ORF Transcript_11364/g.10289 Transcript_11364/m.10289 type:complete len:115 (+) Transcript_11364:221-565(+)
MHSLGFEPKNQIIYQMMEDIEEEEAIDFEAFLDMMTKEMKNPDSHDSIKKIFSLFDEDSTGKISIKNLKKIAKDLGENMTEAELYEIIERADINGDGEIDLDEFYTIMTKKTFT